MTSHLRRALSTAICRNKGLVNPVIGVDLNHTGGTDVPLAREMSKLLRFHAWTSPKDSKGKESAKKKKPDRRTKWDGFEEKVSESKHLVAKVLNKDGCVESNASSSSSQPLRCDGTFRHTWCVHTSCTDLATAKRQVEARIAKKAFKAESDLYTPTENMLEALTLLTHRMDAKRSAVQVRHSPTIKTPMGIKRPDFGIFDETGEALLLVEVKFPRIKLRSSGVPNNPQSIAEDYNEKFRRAIERNKHKRDDQFQLDALEKAIIQTSFYGVSIETGLCALYTLNDVVFFQTRPRIDLNGKVTQIDVLTSKVYPCQPHRSEASTLDGMFGALMIAPDVEKVLNVEHTQRYLSAQIDKENDRKNNKDKDDSDGEGGGNRSSGHKAGSSSAHRAGSSSAHKAGSSSAQKGSSSKSHEKDKKKQKNKNRGTDRPFVSFLVSQMMLENMGNLPNRFENVKKKERIRMLESLGKDEYWCLNKVEMEDMFKKHYYEEEGEGSSGTVLRADIGKFPVAIKVWNINSEMDLERMFEYQPTSLDCLKHEIEIYKRFVDEFPELLSKVIPRLYAVVEAEEWTSLATEYVGDKLERYCLNEGNLDEGPFEWYVNGELLSVRDRKQIDEAGAKAAEELYSRGIIHGDLREDNLRVQRITDENGEPNWRAWWIDYGLTKIHKGKSYEAPEWRLGMWA